MKKFLCILSTDNKLSTHFSFDNEFDYLSFLYSNRKEIRWAKLINKETGELCDEYHNLDLFNPESFLLNIHKENFPDTKILLLINKQKVMCFLNVINKYSENGRRLLRDGSFLKFYNVKQSSTFDDEYFIPPNLILIDFEDIEKIYKEVSKDFIRDNYKIKILKQFVDLEGYKIYINDYLVE